MKLSIDSSNWRSASNRVGATSSLDDITLLKLDLPHQEQSNWCWAAIARSLAGYYGLGDFSQSDIVGRMFGRPGDERAANEFNVTALLGEAVRVVGVSAQWSPGRASFHRIAQSIDAGRPVCVCIQWPTGESHYAVIEGYAPRHEELAITDSLFGPSIHPYSAFPHAYQARDAIWRGTWWTAPAVEPQAQYMM